MRNSHHRLMRVFGAAILGFAVAASVSAARAWTVQDAVGALDWCWGDMNEPGHDSDEYLTTLPDGTRRGPESAHGLLLRAISFSNRGKDEMAVDMAAACQGHNADQKAAIEEHSAEVLAWLKAHR